MSITKNRSSIEPKQRIGPRQDPKHRIGIGQRQWQCKIKKWKGQGLKQIIPNTKNMGQR